MCGDSIIAGKLGHLYEHSSDKFEVVFEDSADGPSRARNACQPPPQGSRERSGRDDTWDQRESEREANDRCVACTPADGTARNLSVTS